MKRQNVRSSFAVVLLLALLVPLLAACGGAPEVASPTAAPVAQATAATAPQATSAPVAQATSAPAPEATSAPAPEATAAGGATTGTGNAKPGVLRINLGSEPANVDPQKSSFSGENTFVLMNYQPLMRFDLNMKPIPGAAESYSLSSDGLVYTFKIRANSKYSDGSPLTAKDFEYAWKRLADPEVAGEYQNLPCGIIQGYSEYAVTGCPDAQGKTKTITEAQSLDLPKLRDAVGVKAVDDSTLEIHLVQPTPYFLGMAALWIGAPVRQQDVEKGEDWWYDPANYIGNGPFILKEWDHGNRAVWEANPNWALGPIKLKGVEMAMINESQVAFQAYKNGELDQLTVAAEDLATIESDPVLSKQVVKRAPDATFYLGFNNTRPPFDNKKVRQAFAQALDREAWVRDIQQGLGIPAQSFILPGIPGYEKVDTWAFNPEAAKKTLADAGFPEGKGLPEIKLTFAASARAQVQFEWVANQIKQNLGIDVKLDPVEATAYTELTKSVQTSPQMFFLGWGPDYPDPQNFLSAVFKSGGSSAADIGYSNPELDKILNQADHELDEKKRFELYSQAQKMLLDDSPVVFMYYRQRRVLVQPYVKGVTEKDITPLDRFPGFYNLQNVSVEP